LDIPAKFWILHYYLKQFNPATTVTFSIPKKSLVKLEVFDSPGREESKLISDEMLPATYSKQWNDKGLSSGTYLARLRSGSYIETKKLVVLK